MNWTEYMPTMNTLRVVLDIALVFIIVYVVLKLLRGTRAVPTMVVHFLSSEQLGSSPVTLSRRIPDVSAPSASRARIQRSTDAQGAM